MVKIQFVLRNNLIVGETRDSNNECQSLEVALAEETYGNHWKPPKHKSFSNRVNVHGVKEKMF